MAYAVNRAVVFTLALIATLAVGKARGAEIGLTTDRTGTALSVRGEIQAMDHCRVAVLLANHPQVKRVFVNSPGGDAWAGAYLGRLFGWAGLEAVVRADAVAASAAAVAVIGAARRQIAGAVGLHAPYLRGARHSPLDRAALAATVVEVAAVLESGGMPAADVERVMLTPPNRLHVVSATAMAGFRHRGILDRPRIERVAAACGGTATPSAARPPPPLTIAAEAP
ncbi:MAG: hypothetical protein HY985_04075 [Magnetospirillum sp.]|nr:hypothetical protein [Magnetospirillum sp.]